MNKDRLKELLEAGQITQEEFNSLLKNVEPEQIEEDNIEPGVKEEKVENIDYDKLDKILQGRLDKAMAKERKEKSELKRKLERLQKSKLTDDELKQAEIEEKEKEIAARERTITDRENRYYAVKAIKTAGLDDGSDTALSLVDFVMGEDETEINEKVKAFKELFDKAVTAEVNKRFKENGYKPKIGENLNGGKNPYTKEQFNLTEQMRIQLNNPDLAKQLQQSAGL